MSIGKLIKKKYNTEYTCDYHDLLMLRQISEENHIPIIRRDTELFLSDLIESYKPKRILEIGTAIGYSALFFGIKAPGAEIYSVEKDVFAASAAKHNIKTYGSAQNIHLLIGDGTKVLNKLIKDKTESFDLIFIDAGKSHYIEFFNGALALSKKGTLILSDDISQRGGVDYKDSAIPRKHRTSIRNMQEYIKYLDERKDLETHFTDIGDGLAISIVRG